MNAKTKSDSGGASILKSVSIKKFGLFSDEILEFSTGLNIFIGRNGCGKSHLIKLLYTLVKEFGESPGNGGVLEADRLENRLASKLAGVFRPEGDHIGRLVQRAKGRGSAVVSATFSNDGSIEAHLVSEGWRKLAVLAQLIINGSLTRNGFLFWDEPEANMNPKMVVQLSETLLRLANQGIQVFVVSHDYLLTTRLSLASEYPGAIPEEQRCPVKFFGLARKGSDEKGVSVSSGSKLADLQDNPILAEYAALYDYEGELFAKSQGQG